MSALDVLIWLGLTVLVVLVACVLAVIVGATVREIRKKG